MRLLIARAILSSILLSFPATAFPHPQVADSVDNSGTINDASAGPAAANPFPDDDQSVDAGNTAASTTSSVPAAATTNDPVGSTVSVDQNAGLVDGSDLATPLTPDTTSDDPPPQRKNTPAGTNVTNLGHPGELTGQLLGMSNCSGVFYNPKWDSCNEVTGKITAKVVPHGKRQTPVSKPRDLKAFSRIRRSKRQVIESSNNNAGHENNPTILSGVAGVDDGATPRGGSGHNVPRTANNWNVPFEDTDNSGISASGSSPNTGSSGTVPQTGIVPPGISPFTADIGKREAQGKSPGNNNFWNTPFELPQEQEETGNPAGGKARRQEKSPGNNNFWNTPFEAPQDQVVEIPAGGKIRRQSSGTTDLRLESGPLSGENRDLDGAIPYMQVDPPKSKRQWDQSPHVEVGPAGPGGARNIIINKRENQTANTGPRASVNSNNDPAGYLGKLSHSGSGLDFEDPSRDSATPPREPSLLGKRAQPDFRYVPLVHTGPNTGNRGADIPRAAVMNRRQISNGSSTTRTGEDGQGGYLGELGKNEAAAAEANAPIIPSRPGKPGKRD